MEDNEDTRDVCAPMLTTLPSRVNSQSWVKEHQKVAKMEIACTLIDCNISFNVLRTDQWKRMVRAIAQVGNIESWLGLDYKKMRTTTLDEQRALIDKALLPVKAGWQEFGCTIISDGWSDIHKRHIDGLESARNRVASNSCTLTRKDHLKGAKGGGTTLLYGSKEP